jgi:hypothetical protein
MCSEIVHSTCVYHQPHGTLLLVLTNIRSEQQCLRVTNALAYSPKSFTGQKLLYHRAYQMLFTSQTVVCWLNKGHSFKTFLSRKCWHSLISCCVFCWFQFNPILTFEADITMYLWGAPLLSANVKLAWKCFLVVWKHPSLLHNKRVFSSDKHTHTHTDTQIFLYWDLYYFLRP